MPRPNAFDLEGVSEGHNNQNPQMEGKSNV